MKNEQLTEISQTVSQMVTHPLRPLSALRSIKMKIGFLVLGAVGTTVIVYWIGLRFGLIWPSLMGIVAAIIALMLTRFFAGGMTSPLREMAEVSKKMAQGDYSKRVSSTSQDEIGALAQTFNSMADKLSKTENVRRELIANASHELKTPLTALQAQLENIVDGIEEPTNEKMITLLSQTEHLSALVKQLLDLSKLESGVTALELSTLDLYSTISSAKEVVSASNPNIKFDIQDNQVEITGDFHRLVQVFTNLFGNSSRYCPIDGVIECTFSRNKEFVEISVQDNGPGIDESVRGTIFERFSRADNSRNSRDGGAGIGLAITKQIINMHNGQIQATESDLGGCRIDIILPIEQPLQKNSSLNGDNAIETNINNKQYKETTSWHSIPSTTY